MKRIPAFTVLLLMSVAAVAGLASVPMLNVQYSPATQENNITVSYSWQNASERTMEAEVTSRIEGVLSGIQDVSSVRSVSEKESGYVRLSFRKGTDMASARLNVASCIRNIYSCLPEGVSYPKISLNTRGSRSRSALVYVVKSPLPSMEIYKFVSSNIIFPLSAVDGVDKVSLWGATPYEMEITFDSDLVERMDIGAEQIASAFRTGMASESLGMASVEGETVNMRLEYGVADDIGDIPVSMVDGRIVHLRDIATWKCKESEPASYFRVNGLNTIMLSVDVSQNSNLIKTTSSVKSCISELERQFPDEVTLSLSYDASEYISTELNKIYFRTVLCVLILLLFVFLVSRSWRYLFIIFSTLVVNISVSIVFYNISGLAVHIYTLAGITVSLGIVIDTSIVMADHYSYYRNRSIFPALLGATATTIGALCVIMLMPEQERANLSDFYKVIIINLSVALFTAYIFVPSLIDRFPIRASEHGRSFHGRRMIVKWNRFYTEYIVRGLRFRWLYLLALAAVFSVSSYFFIKALDRADFYREPGRDKLYVHAGMPEGCSVAQLNEVVKSMENYLSSFDGIEMFTATISSYQAADIEITFKPEYEKTSFPSELKSKVISMANNFGGANWRVWGVNQSYFNNNVTSSYKSHRIYLKGYNYDELSEYASALIDDLGQNRRVSGPEILTERGIPAASEFNMRYDFERMAVAGVSPYGYYNKLHSILYDTVLPDIQTDDGLVPVVLRSSRRDDFDLWHILNLPVAVDSVQVKLSEMGSIEKKRTGIPIIRENQSYEIAVGYDFIGPYELAKTYTEETVAHLNDKILPVGFKAELPEYGYWGQKDRERHLWLILLVVALVFVMCSITFESLRLPFAVILIIPLSFVGVFMTFGFSDFVFDQGGFAAFVMLSGIVVNAGIYLVTEYCQDKSLRPEPRKYVKAFNHKIIPVLLTIVSSVLGLVPFLFDGPDEVFWFPFAVGTISGLMFSIIGLVFILPLFVIAPSSRVSPSRL